MQPNIRGNRPDLEQADRAAEKALEDQRAAEKNAIADQQAVRDKLTADVMARNKSNLEAYHANKDMHGLPAAPKAPALMEITGTPQQKAQREEQGKQALAAYKDAGYLTTRDNAVHTPGMNPAEQALAAEKAFRERQQQLADKIADPHTSPEQRERLELVKTTEYHTHKADQMANVLSMERDMLRYSMAHQATGEKIVEHQKQVDHHRSQAALGAQQLHTFDHARNAVPKEVQARMGHAAQQPPLQHNTQGQKNLASDPHLQALAHDVGHQQTESTGAVATQGHSQATSKDLPAAQNPAAARLLARIQAAGERNDAKTTPELDQRMQEIGANREKLAASQELQKTEALGRKAELEQRAAVRH